MTLTVNHIDEKDGTLTTAKLNLVDLAGSEKVKDAATTGE